MPHSVNKGLPLLHTTGIVAKAHTAIVQLDCFGDKLLVSTMTKCAIVDLKRFIFILFSRCKADKKQCCSTLYCFNAPMKKQPRNGCNKWWSQA